MFSDTCFDILENFLSNLDNNTAYPEIYDKRAVIAVITNLKYLMLLSDSQEPYVEMSSNRKFELYTIALDLAIVEYNKHMEYAE